MYELYEVNTDRLLKRGSVEDIARYIGCSKSYVWHCTKNKLLLNWCYYVKRIYRKDRHRKHYDVYQDGVLVDECMDIRDIAQTYYMCENNVRDIARLGRTTKDGISFKERTDYE